MNNLRETLKTSLFPLSVIQFLAISFKLSHDEETPGSTKFFYLLACFTFVLISIAIGSKSFSEMCNHFLNSPQGRRGANNDENGVGEQWNPPIFLHDNNYRILRQRLHSTMEMILDLRNDTLPNQNNSTEMRAANNEQQNPLHNFSPVMARYLQRFGLPNTKKNSEEIVDCKIPDSEIKPFLCPISFCMMDTPVLLDNRCYDLNSLLTISKNIKGARIDPITRDEFYLIQIMPAQNEQAKIEKLINTYKVPEANKKAKFALNFFRKENYRDAEINFKAAIYIYEKAEIKNERLGVYYYNLASTYRHLGHIREAIRYCEKCVSLRTTLFGVDNESTQNAVAKLQEFRKEIEAVNNDNLQQLNRVS